MHIAAAKAKCGNGEAVVSPFSWVAFDQGWQEIFSGFDKELRRVAGFVDSVLISYQ